MLKRIIFFLILFSLLTSCSSTRKDGPPSYNVDVSKIPDAVPKRERPSKIGNKPTYTVFGKKYYVMSSSKNYDEQGIASWYGTRFHQHYTSNGERYDMLAMTAAHKTLPLPTYVQVTNLRNGRKIIVKVNDRGPFEANRIIDLSYAAAKKLAMLGHGTTWVDVKAIDPDTYRPPVPSSLLLFFNNKTVQPNYVSHGVYLQVGAFRDKFNAEKLKDRLQPQVALPITITQLARTTNNLYHVQVGPINDVETADRIYSKLKAMGIDSEKYHTEA